MRWKALPPSLDMNGRRFVSTLRQLKDHSGLTLKALQAKTCFSASSWDRYLNGTVLPPAAAVEALARIADADTGTVLALREAAEKTWNTAAEQNPPDGNEPEEAKGPGTDGPQIRVAALSLTAGTVLFSAVLSVALVVDTHQPAPGSARGSGSAVGKYDCVYTRRGDLLFSGNSTTSTRRVMLNSTGPDTAEVQCLLLRHKLSPGDIDGYFGPHTEAQVKRLQERDHVPADGVVGEETWRLLRHVQ
ncbi:Helix-turn-helix domain-containing protein [Streptomyces misionensis]|uniref:Helix-turn-helix domain-containing protein n=1 Tax=Streptomyces misionensis TaxID=67331 RepID=A0A1H4LZT3_9ACTN|nr:Helix-turn-helix domain-containing protein [Streptomyces misionensis]